MHPWRLIINGKTEKDNDTIVCFMCLESVPYTKETKDKFMEHMTTVHSADCSVEFLSKMCQEAEERQWRQGWSFNDIIIEEKEWREAKEKRREETKEWMGLCRRKTNVVEPNLEEDVINVKCALCKLIGYSKKTLEKHLEKDHEVIFGIKEITNQGDKEPNSEEDTYF